MRVFISVDMEGIVGVVSLKHVISDSKEYERARKWMTLEVKAAVEALQETGAEKIVVADSHGSMINLLIEELPEYVDVVAGFPRATCMVAYIDKGFDTALFLGYHSKKGTIHSILDHTISGSTIQRIKINGFEVSEFWLNAAVAGYYNVPISLVTGDDKLIEHAKNTVPNIETIVTKYALGRRAALTKNPKTIEKEIRKAVPKAIEKVKKKQVASFKPHSPFNVELEFTDSTMADVAELIPIVKRIQGNIVGYTTQDIVEAYKLMEALIIMAIGIQKR